MAGLDKRKEERLIKAVKDLSKLPPNKRCADCTEKLPQYVNLTFNTFVCTGTGMRVWVGGLGWLVVCVCVRNGGKGRQTGGRGLDSRGACPSSPIICLCACQEM